MNDKIEISTPGQSTPGLLHRMACWLYEGTLLFGVVFVAGFIYAALTEQQHALIGRHGLMALLFVVLGVYFIGFWLKGGQTLAMKTWHIRVTDRQGLAPQPLRLLLRYLLAWLWFLPPLAVVAPFHLSGAEITVIVIGWVIVYALLALLHPQRQFWHDALAGTRLINTRHHD